MSLNNVIPAWMLDDKNWWYIEWTDGTRTKFMAPDKKQAHHRFMMEGDHAYTYGKLTKEEAETGVFR